MNTHLSAPANFYYFRLQFYLEIRFAFAHNSNLTNKIFFQHFAQLNLRWKKIYGIKLSILFAAIFSSISGSLIWNKLLKWMSLLKVLHIKYYVLRFKFDGNTFYNVEIEYGIDWNEFPVSKRFSFVYHSQFIHGLGFCFASSESTTRSRPAYKRTEERKKKSLL